MSRTVLIIEDNEQNRYLVRYLLENEGYKVVMAENGTQGIEAALRIQPDLILLDILLPQMDGYAVARSIRELTSLKFVPIVAVTSFAMAGDREKSLEAGCNGYIEKPINPETFVAEIEQYFSTR